MSAKKVKPLYKVSETSNSEFPKHKYMLKGIPFVKKHEKQMVFENDKKKESLLDESQIKE